ncbi:hypothetical protein [Caulobacter phage Cr30]|uniref:hypothetical protein n=1 Tax=Caulobacter phage Cr30 TaxID=1357714 RepID=UPI0004A9B8EE|nr:hypothetical protein OZ74_gp235 [Caulobacter phage Cr30]AGS81108.1 hypothetical protein [Caulobacter phage Cr30]
MAKIEKLFRVYVFDQDGSERLGATVFAKSEPHAKIVAKGQRIHPRSISCVVELSQKGTF